MKTKLKAIALFALLISSCKEKNEPIIVTTDEYHASVDKITNIMIHDIFSPPVASRIFAYPNIAAYEIVAQNNSDYATLVGQIKDLTSIPTPDKDIQINYQVSALIAHMDLSRKLIFSEDKMEVLRDSLYKVWETKNRLTFNNSKAYGLKVAEHIAKWMDKDNYKQTRTMPKFTVDTDDQSRWQPTPPSYMDGIEPHWSKIRPFALDSASQFKPVPPPPFSMDKNSKFYKELIEVYNVSNEMEKKGDTCEEIAIAQFWDCNPYVSVTQGHLMFAKKKITPGAHWIGITKIASKKTNADFDKTIFAHTKTSIAMYDAFISCWDEKYRSNLIRPETLINQYIDENWKPVLQTPPFPEYTSGHSVVSGAAATTLTSIFGENFDFEDDSEINFGLPVRHFKSFLQAADEAAISRMYGGIHYRSAVEVGINQGRDLGGFVNKKLTMLAK
ncbi:vanadium-dependent haloperoxidase [Cellulophaga sp. E16_2]|uniref:Phosphoesterase PA-phosphatase related protein n=1 Tax=Cellulophaga algicola (strain DSM 14237 / IC166 / ACAM 630) TaxID=688270 RepID=E6X4Z9_CELAD|nr:MULTISPECIES: vanadium-dependent haloperoxidase [Cellulophaga]ADV48310.1 phosphoesterase PA-phosphatase related protein [Cellulophaga algicola DSM 14237]MBO0590731.1 vanadium-dependent haloperoxidase [Cellulophaga sp. E16_2]